MEWITIIISVIAAVVYIVAAKVSISSFRYTKQMSKGNIKRQIAAKERQIRDIQNRIYDRYGINDNGTGRAMSKLDYMKAKLQAEIEDLRLEFYSR